MFGSTNTFYIYPSSFQVRVTQIFASSVLLKVTVLVTMRMAGKEMDCNVKKLGQRFQVISLCLGKITKNFKGALSRIFSIYLNSQNIYLCREKPTNNGLFLFAIAILVR